MARIVTLSCKPPAEVNILMIFVAGYYYIGPKNQAYEVYCNMTTRETCIRRNTKTPEVNHNTENGVYWLSAKGIDVINTLYNVSFVYFVFFGI